MEILLIPVLLFLFCAGIRVIEMKEERERAEHLKSKNDDRG